MEHELFHSSCGSPCYASPEMLSGSTYSGISTDLWDAGIVLHYTPVGTSTLSLESIDLIKRIWQVDQNKRTKRI